MPRIDEAVSRIMLIKFEQGLFEKPYVDIASVPQIVGQPALQSAALKAQARSLVLLKNVNRTVPVRPTGIRVFLSGIDPIAAANAGFTPVRTLEEADMAIVRVSAPWRSEHKGWIMGRSQHEGDLSFLLDNKNIKAIKAASQRVPTIVSVYLDRPAIVTPLRDAASALIADFGVSDAALLRAITGQTEISGHLPFELPSSMEDVRAQREDVPFDTASPIYNFGYGVYSRALKEAAPPKADVPSWATENEKRNRGYSTASSSIGDLLANPEVRAILNRHLPQLMTSSNIDRMKGLKLRRLQSVAPNLVTDNALVAIDSDLNALPQK